MSQFPARVLNKNKIFTSRLDFKISLELFYRPSIFLSSLVHTAFGTEISYMSSGNPVGILSQVVPYVVPTFSSFLSFLDFLELSGNLAGFEEGRRKLLTSC